jgi:hypothetical protein
VANINSSGTNGYGVATNNANYFNGATSGTTGTWSTPTDFASIALDLVNGRVFVNRNPTAGQVADYQPCLSGIGSTGTDISAIFANVNAKLTALFRANTTDTFTVVNSGFQAVPPIP